MFSWYFAFYKKQRKSQYKRNNCCFTIQMMTLYMTKKMKYPIFIEIANQLQKHWPTLLLLFIIRVLFLSEADQINWSVVTKVKTILLFMSSQYWFLCKFIRLLMAILYWWLLDIVFINTKLPNWQYFALVYKLNSCQYLKSLEQYHPTDFYIIGNILWSKKIIILIKNYCFNISHYFVIFG